jgi:hypothetical protein
MSSKDPQAEELRLQNATDLMYGNRDRNRIFPFETSARFQYLIYSEKLRVAEDGVTTYSSESSKRYQFFSPEAYDDLIVGQGRRNYFERKGLKYTILHDPFLQAEKEGIVLKNKNAKVTGMTLAEKLAKVKDANDFVPKSIILDDPIEFPQEETIEIEQDEPDVNENFTTEKAQPKRSAKRKEVIV